MTLPKKLMKTMEDTFDSRDSNRVFFAPGRVNLIGEHTDYNGGYVLPCALEIGTYAVAQKREDRECHLYSVNFPEEGVITFSLDDLVNDEKDGWANYPKGVIKAFINKGVEVRGLNIVFEGNIPNGAGLSSSASIELVTSVMLNEMFEAGLSMLEMVELAKEVENEFIGVNCGIMDQFAIGMGKNHHAVMLHCDSLKYEYLPIKLDRYSIIIANTNKQRGLATSAYNERRESCESALKKLQGILPLQTVSDITLQQLNDHAELLVETEIKRVRHVITENQRTKKAAQALINGNLSLFGVLMNQSHESLKKDYEVTGIELDTLVELARKQNGTIGARMTGAGFGGCTVNIVEDDKVEAFIEEVGNAYKERIGWAADFYTAKIGDGAKEVDIKEEIT